MMVMMSGATSWQEEAEEEAQRVASRRES